MKTAFLIACLAFVAGTNAMTTEERFGAFVSKYDKTFADSAEYAAKMAIFKSNWNTVEAKNRMAAGMGHEEVFGMTPFLDMTPAEFESTFLTLQVPDVLPEAPLGVFQQGLRSEEPLSSIDYRTRGKVTPVKNQGQCGSCWAFSATESVESANAMAGNTLTSLAPEQIVDCDHTDQGCNGGLPSNAFKYVMGTPDGLEKESSYPYTAGGGSAGSCQASASKEVQTIAGWSYATQTKSESAMRSAMLAKGPLSVCVDASAWQFYSGGIMTASQCGGTQLDHAVQAVGFDTSGSAYWLVRNSWGGSWGEEGYIRLAMDTNTCGVAQLVTYATAK